MPALPLELKACIVNSYRNSVKTGRIAEFNYHSVPFGIFKSPTSQAVDDNEVNGSPPIHYDASMNPKAPHSTILSGKGANDEYSVGRQMFAFDSKQEAATPSKKATWPSNWRATTVDSLTLAGPSDKHR